MRDFPSCNFSFSRVTTHRGRGGKKVGLNAGTINGYTVCLKQGLPANVLAFFMPHTAFANEGGLKERQSFSSPPLIQSHDVSKQFPPPVFERKSRSRSRRRGDLRRGGAQNKNSLNTMASTKSRNVRCLIVLRCSSRSQCGSRSRSRSRTSSGGCCWV